MKVAHIDAFHRDTKRFWSFYRPRFAELDEKLPNPAHEALAELEQPRPPGRGRDPEHRPPALEGRLRAGDRGPRLDRDLELHRPAARSYPLENVGELFDADGVATCACCMGKVKPDVVLFGELLPEAAMAEARAALRAAPTCCSASAPRSRSTRSPACRS